MAFGIIATIAAVVYMILLSYIILNRVIFNPFIFETMRIFSFILFIVSVTAFVIFEGLYWRWYSRRLRYFCNICKSTVQPKSTISDTIQEPTDAKEVRCPTCGAVKGDESTVFCSFCGSKF